MVTTYARMKVDPGRARTEPGPLGGSCRGMFPSLEPNKVVVGEILLLYSSPGVYRRQARCGTRGRTLAGRGAGVSVAAATGHLRSICAHWPPLSWLLLGGQTQAEPRGLRAGEGAGGPPLAP